MRERYLVSSRYSALAYGVGYFYGNRIVGTPCCIRRMRMDVGKTKGMVTPTVVAICVVF